MIRMAEDGDVPGILAIVNDVIASSTAIYRDEGETLEARTAWFRARRALGYPVLVKEIDGAIVGFASFGDFRTGHGYRFTVEHSVHVDRRFRGQGHGRGLIAALLPYAEECGKHAMAAAIDADNAASLAVHEKLGFERVALFREIGWKFERWLDLVFMQLRLG